MYFKNIFKYTSRKLALFLYLVSNIYRNITRFER